MSQNQIILESQKQNFPHALLPHSNMQLHRLGLFVFNIPEDQIKSLVPENSVKLINANSAYHFSKQEMHRIRLWLDYCVEWNHGILELGSHGFKNFFMQFRNIKMNNLLVLNVENNNINSIEMIQSFYAPNLDCIYLHGNPITSVKSLRKTNFPKLSRLYINILDNEYLSEFKSQNLSLIQNLPRTLQTFEWKKYNSNRWITKINSSKLSRVIIGTKKYAENLDQKCLLVIAKKNKGLNIK